MTRRWSLVVGLVAVLASVQVRAEVLAQRNLVYAVHDGVKLLGDLYRPAAPGPHPAMLFIHGGAWKLGSKAGYGITWGPYLAERGFVVFAIDYRLSSPGHTMWPQAIADCKAALQYLRGNAAALGVDPDRIGAGGDSAGGELSAMLGLTQDFGAFAGRYPGDPFSHVSTRLKVVVPAYGVFDMIAWWKYTLTSRTDTPLEQLFGGVPTDLPGPYLEASPLSYARQASRRLGNLALENDGAKIAWFVTWGTADPVVPAREQSEVFVDALRKAGTRVTEAPVPGAGHFWFTRSLFTGTRVVPPAPGGENDFIADRLVRFLRRNLAGDDSERDN